jgi:hypothetical protein
MKKILIALGVVTFLTSFVLLSNAEIINALKSGNATEVAKYFDNTVEITFPGKTNSYNKKQAEVALREFFTNNPVKDFEVIHQSESAGSQYCIGNLTTNTGVFRTTVYTKQRGNKHLIQELRFEK